MTLYCVHRWGTHAVPYYNENNEQAGVMRKCLGLCGAWWKDKEPEPETAVAQSE